MNDMTINVNALPEQLMQFFPCKEVRVQERDGGVFLSDADNCGAPESVSVRSIEELNSELKKAEERSENPNTKWISSEDFFERARSNL
ncbi:MAG: hypothetical protein FWF94_00975 [Oscillospiraceae bacterium]|nr:hypothetical protein [Oscillospiraceae bacterium]